MESTYRTDLLEFYQVVGRKFKNMAPKILEIDRATPASPPVMHYILEHVGLLGQMRYMTFVIIDDDPAGPYKRSDAPYNRDLNALQARAGELIRISLPFEEQFSDETLKISLNWALKLNQEQLVESLVKGGDSADLKNPWEKLAEVASLATQMIFINNIKDDRVPVYEETLSRIEKLGVSLLNTPKPESA